MSRLTHVNPILLVSSTDSTDVEIVTNVTIPSKNSNSTQKKAPQALNDENDNGTFIFNFDCEVYVANKKERSGFMRINCSRCKIEWKSTDFDLDALKNECLKWARSDDSKRSITAVLKEEVWSKKSLGVWTAYIAKSRSFPKKKDKRLVLDNDNVQDWVQEAHSEYPKLEAGLSFMVPSPIKVKAQAEKAARTDELTELAERKQLRKESRKKSKGHGDDNSEGSDSESHSSDGSDNLQNDPQTSYAYALLNKHEMNKKIDGQYPAILDPTDPTRYFSLTWHKAQEWAKHRHEDGVDHTHPPAHFKYDLQKKTDSGSKKVPTNPIPSNPSTLNDVIAGFVQALSPQKPNGSGNEASTAVTQPIAPTEQNQVLTEPPSSPTCYNPAEPNGTDGFFKYCKFPIDKKEKIQRIFEEFELTDHRMINSENLPRKELNERGVSHMVITGIYKDADRYRTHRLEERNAAKRARNEY